MDNRSPLWLVIALPAWWALRQRRREAGPASVAPIDSTGREHEILLHKYELVQTGFLAVMNEFWQTNAFFTAFAGLAVAAIATSWTDFERADLAMTVPLTALVVVLMLIWLLSILRHNQHTDRLARRAVALQSHIRRVEGTSTDSPATLELFADVWSDRPFGRLGLRRTWTFVPILFVATLVGLQIAAAL